MEFLDTQTAYAAHVQDRAEGTILLLVVCSFRWIGI